MSEPKRIVDAELYRELSAPFSSKEEAMKHVDAFSADLRKLRKKHRIANVNYGCGVFVKTDEGSEFLVSFGWNGDEFLQPVITGAADRDQQKRVPMLLAQASRLFYAAKDAATLLEKRERGEQEALL